MVSGHTVKKPTINVSRVNSMQHLQNINLSMIEQGSSTPERALSTVSKNLRKNNFHF